MYISSMVVWYPFEPPVNAAYMQHQIGALAQPMWTPPMDMGGRGGDIKVTASRQAAGAHAKHKNGLAA